jgi:hypothetical protein
MNNLEHRLLRCFSSVFPDLNENQIRNASVDSVPGWHSLASVTLISVVQEDLACKWALRICPISCLSRRYKIMSNTMPQVEPQSVGDNSNLASRPAVREPHREVKENLWSGIRNRVCQHLARILPGARTLRISLHRWRGVNIGKNV